MGGAPLDWAKEGSRFKVQGSRFKVVVAASPRIYMGAMPESGIQVTGPQSLATPPCFHTSGFWWRLRCILDDGIPVSPAFPSLRVMLLS